MSTASVSPKRNTKNEKNKKFLATRDNNCLKISSLSKHDKIDHHNSVSPDERGNIDSSGKQKRKKLKNNKNDENISNYYGFQISGDFYF